MRARARARARAISLAAAPTPARAPLPPARAQPVDAGTKKPSFKHAGGSWTWECYEKLKLDHSTVDVCISAYTLSSLWCGARARARTPFHASPPPRPRAVLHDLAVVDVDSVAQARELEERFPSLLTAPRETTRKGMHYFFKRSEACDRDGFYDGSAQLTKGIDFKSITRTGTGGIVVVAPSTGKSWVTAIKPYSAPCSDIPDVRRARAALRARRGARRAARHPPLRLPK